MDRNIFTERKTFRRTGERMVQVGWKVVVGGGGVVGMTTRGVHVPGAQGNTG